MMTEVLMSGNLFSFLLFFSLHAYSAFLLMFFLCNLSTHFSSLEKSYEIIPNFTAADAFRLMGFGRNQFINTMNTFKSENFQFNQRNWFSSSDSAANHSIQTEMIRKYLPFKPLQIPLQYWWIAHLGVLGEKDILVSFFHF